MNERSREGTLFGRHRIRGMNRCAFCGDVVGRMQGEEDMVDFERDEVVVDKLGPLSYANEGMKKIQSWEFIELRMPGSTQLCAMK